MRASHLFGDEVDSTLHSALGLNLVLLQKYRPDKLVYPLAVFQLVELLLDRKVTVHFELMETHAPPLERPDFLASGPLTSVVLVLHSEVLESVSN